MCEVKVSAEQDLLSEEHSLHAGKLFEMDYAKLISFISAMEQNIGVFHRRIHSGGNTELYERVVAIAIVMGSSIEHSQQVLRVLFFSLNPSQLPSIL